MTISTNTETETTITDTGYLDTHLMDASRAATPLLWRQCWL